MKQDSLVLEAEAALFAGKLAKKIKIINQIMNF